MGTIITKAKDKWHLQELIEKEMKKHGNRCDLNFVDLSEIIDLSYLFKNSKFKGDISGWDVSKVKNMDSMFEGSQFNGDISGWDVSQVETTDCMFYESQFNGDISKWNVSNVLDMSMMFANSEFNGDISKWDVSNVKNMYYMFFKSKFKGTLSEWDISNTKCIDGIFKGCSCQKPWWYIENEKERKEVILRHNGMISLKETIEKDIFSCAEKNNANNIKNIFKI